MSTVLRALKKTESTTRSYHIEWGWRSNAGFEFLKYPNHASIDTSRSFR